MKDLEKPLITVGNLCFNTGKHVVKTLDSILNQTYQNFELIIIDDASSDNSVELIESWIKENSVKCNFIKHEKNKGICKTANEIVALSKGKYISLVGDDLWKNDFLETCMEAYNLPEAQNVSLVYASNDVLYLNENRMGSGVNPIEICKRINYPRIDQLFKKIKNDFYIMTNPNLTDILFWFNPVVAICACSRVESIKSSGGYNEDLPFEDYDMWFKLSDNSSFIYIDAVKATYVQHDINFTQKRKYDVFYGVLIILLENYKKILFKDTRKYCTKIIISSYAMLVSLRKEKTMKYHLRKIIPISNTIYKLSPYLFLNIIILSPFQSSKNILKKIIKRLFSLNTISQP